MRLCLILLALLASCVRAPVAIPATPIPPQVIVAKSVNLLAQSLAAASSAIIAARDQGVLSPADTRAAQNVIVALATTGKRVDAVLRSPDPWETQRITILVLVLSSGVQEGLRRLPVPAVSILSASVALYQQISGAVGGGGT